ncbi:hypothetical protein [Micromonospora sp. NPDC003776]
MTRTPSPGPPRRRPAGPRRLVLPATLAVLTLLVIRLTNSAARRAEDR